MAYKNYILGLLGQQDPIRVLEASPAKLELYFETLSVSGLERSYSPNKWTARDIFAHLADAEIVFGYRMRQAVAEQQHLLQSVDQTLWAKNYSRLEPALALDSLRALRMWNLALLTTFDLHDWLKETFHPDHGLEPIDTMLRYWAGHDLHHLAQLEAIARASPA